MGHAAWPFLVKLIWLCRLTIRVHVTVNLQRHGGQWWDDGVEPWSSDSIVIDGGTVYGTAPHMLNIWGNTDRPHFLQILPVSVQKHVPECRASWVFIRVLGWPMLMKHPWFLCTWSTITVRLWSWFCTHPPQHTCFVGFTSHFRKKNK